ncbi:hypothetical protein P7C70_g389, partial [Phenoliferia sp. Uapishka_3]
MPFDLTHPRAVLPLQTVSTPSLGDDRNDCDIRPRPSRPAIHLKLSEDILAHLSAQARKGIKVPMRIALGDSPAFLINGVSYPINLSPEAAHSELVRSSRSSRDLEPITTVSHKASFKPGFNKGALEKVSLSLRENREIAEREREGKRYICILLSAPTSVRRRREHYAHALHPRTPLLSAQSYRAVLLDSAPKSGRASSHTRPLSSSSSAKRTLSPAGSAGSRAPSPAQRPPSRLSAVPVKNVPRPSAVRPPTSSFRIGKGTVPASLSMSRSNSNEDKGSGAEGGTPAESAGTTSTGPGLSPATSVSTPPSPAVTAVEVHSAKPNDAPLAASAPGYPAGRQTSSSSSSTSSQSHDSSLHQSSSTVTSQSSHRSTNHVSAVAPLPPAPIPTTKLEPPKKAAVARGGVMKGKDTLKKEKRTEERAKGRVLSAPIIRDSDDEDAAGSSTSTSKQSSLPSLKAAKSISSLAAPKSPVSAAPPALAPPSRALPKAVQLPSFTKRASTTDLRGEPESGNTTAADKKRRKLLNGAAGDDDGHSSKSKSRSPSIPGVSKTSASSDRSAAGGSSSSTKKRPRREERWYSSSDEDEVVPPRDSSTKNTTSVNKDREKRLKIDPYSSARSGSEAEDARGRAPVRVPSHLKPQESRSKVGSPLRPNIVVVSRPVATPAVPPSAPPPAPAPVSSTVADPPPAAPAPTATKKASILPPEYQVPDLATYDSQRAKFEALYKSYSDLHKTLMSERDVCINGGRPNFDVDEVEKLVKRIERERNVLKSIKEGLVEWVAQENAR